MLIAIFFIGKNAGSNQTNLSVVQNMEMVKQIAELASLEVTGTTTVKLSNVSGDSWSWEQFKDYLFENTLQVIVPFSGKYGLVLGKDNIKIDTKDSIVTISFPAAKLLSLQLRLDQLQTMNQSGLFARTTIGDLVRAEKQMYLQVEANMMKRADFIQLSQKHIQDIFQKYYLPLGFHVKCEFQ